MAAAVDAMAGSTTQALRAYAKEQIQTLRVVITGLAANARQSKLVRTSIIRQQ